MKAFIILSLAAACFAQIPYQGKYVLVSEDGIVIKGDNGKEIDLHKSALYPGKVELLLKTPYAPVRKIQVDQVNNIENAHINPLDFEYLHGPYHQHDVLVHLFHPYQGLVDAVRYEQLLEKLHKYVQAGYVHETIGDILRHYWTQQYHLGEYEHATPYYQNWNQYVHSPASQTVSPLQRLYFYLQQQQYPQTYYHQTSYPQSYWYKQYEPEHGTYQETHQALPWALLKSGVEAGKWTHPYQYQQQSAWGPWAHQQQYPGFYQGQQSWNPQQWWNNPNHQHQALIEAY